MTRDAQTMHLERREIPGLAAYPPTSPLADALAEPPPHPHLFPKLPKLGVAHEVW